MTYQLQSKHGDTYWIDAQGEVYHNLRVAVFRAREISTENLGPGIRVYNTFTKEVVVTYAPGGVEIPSERYRE